MWLGPVETECFTIGHLHLLLLPVPVHKSVLFSNSIILCILLVDMLISVFPSSPFIYLQHIDSWFLVNIKIRYCHYIHVLIIPDLTNRSPRMCPVCVRSPTVSRPHHSLCPLLLFGTTSCSNFILNCLHPSPGISHIFKEPCFPFVENDWYSGTKGWVPCLLIAAGVSLLIGPLGRQNHIQTSVSTSIPIESHKLYWYLQF